MTTKPTAKRVEREARLRWIPLDQMEVCPAAQREYKPQWAKAIADNMDLEQLGNLTVNERDGVYYIVDGQHRWHAYKLWNGDGNWQGQQLQCWTYTGLTLREEAEIFLKLNDRLTVSTFDKFRAAVTAGRAEECEINRIVEKLGLKISRTRSGGGILAVGTLRKVYRLDSGALYRALRIISEAFGEAGLEAHLIEGFGLLCHRYNGDLNDATAISKFSAKRLSALENSAEKLRQQIGSSRAHCVAAEAVRIYNRGPGAKKLPPWWDAL